MAPVLAEEHRHEERRRLWYLPMVARDTREEHRAATTLELFFDLCFVVAVALAASNLHHEVSEGHTGDGVFSYALVFFAIWWAWMSFTWFASAYDTDDGLYRMTTFVIMAGVLIMAAGIPRAFESTDIGLMTAGYVIMRLAMILHWIRAGRTDPRTRPGAFRFAIGIGVLQILWVGRLFLPDAVLVASIFPLVLGELLVPVWADRAVRLSWHPHHIAERYGLFTIIVLGETILAATLAFQSAADSDFADIELIALAIATLVIVFSMWWLYFDEQEHPDETSLPAAYMWGYGHLLIFAAAAAVGAGIAVEVDHKTEVAHIGLTAVSLATAVPVALYLIGVWVVHVLPNREGITKTAFPIVAVLVLASSFVPWALVWVAVLLAVLVGLVLLDARRVGPESVA